MSKQFAEMETLKLLKIVVWVFVVEETGALRR